MSTAAVSIRVPAALENGARMTQPEFHRLYRRTPPGFKAELLGGVVTVASPVYTPHARPHQLLGGLLDRYEDGTPGTQALDNATVILGPKDEPQPDLFLRILPKYGGRTRIRGGLVNGPPELVIEVANSSGAIDLGTKRERYAVGGVREYVVADVQGELLHAFDFLAEAQYGPDADGVLRLRHFPGFWIHAVSLFTNKGRRLRRFLAAGVATPEHAAFVAQLNARKRAADESRAG